MASDSNLKNNQFRVVLPVILTFGASLVFFQGNAHADDANVTANTAVTTTQTSDNQQSSNYQNANVALMTAQAVQTHAAEQLANTDPNKGAVDISAENAQNVANAPAVDTQPSTAPWWILSKNCTLRAESPLVLMLPVPLTVVEAVPFSGSAWVLLI